MVSDPTGGVNIPIAATDAATPIIDQLVAKLQSLGASGQAAFSNLDAAGQKSLLTLSNLNTAFTVAADKAGVLSLAEGKAAVETERHAAAALQAALAIDKETAAMQRLAAASAQHRASMAMPAAADAMAADMRSKAIAGQQAMSNQLVNQIGMGQMFLAQGGDPFAVVPSDLPDRLNAAGTAMSRTGTLARQAGMNLTMGLTVPMAALGGVSIATAASFEAEMMQIFSQAGASREEVQQMSKAILDMTAAGQTAQGPNQLASALFDIESMGFRGAEALDILKQSAKGATTGQADLVSVTTALASAMRTGIEGAETSADAMATINAIVGVGRVRMEEFTSSLSSGILPVAAQFGISLRDVGAAFDVLTNAGVPATQAGTRLRMSLSLLAAPTDRAKEALRQIGVTNLEVAHMLRDEGLVPTLEMLQQRLNAFSDDTAAQNEIIVAAFGGGRSSSAIITLLSQLDELRRVHEEIGVVTEDFDEQYEAMLETFAVKWDIFVAKVSANAIKLGNALMPGAIALMNILAPAIELFTKVITELPGPVQTAVAALLALVALAGPILIVFGALQTLGGGALILAGILARLVISVQAGASAYMAMASSQGVAAASTTALSAAMSSALVRMGLIIAALVVIDQISRALSGKSLIDLFSGGTSDSSAAIENAKGQLEAFNDIVARGASRDVARQAVLPGMASELAKITGELDAARAKLAEVQTSFEFKSSPGAKFEIGSELRAQIEQGAKDVEETIKKIREMSPSSEELINLQKMFPDLDQSGEFSRLIFDTVEAEQRFIQATNEARLATGEWTDEMIEASSGLEQLKSEIDGYAQAISDAQALQEELDPATEALELQIAAYEQLKTRAEATGQSTEKYDNIITGLNARLAELNGIVSVNNGMISLYVATLAQVSGNFEAARIKAMQFSKILADLPEEQQMQIHAILPFLELNRLAKLIDDIVSGRYTVMVALRIAQMTPAELDPGDPNTTFLGGPLGQLPGFAKSKQDAFEQALRDIQFQDQISQRESAGAGLNAEDETPDKLNKTEFGLMELAKAFEKFTQLTGSKSIPAFKMWLEAQERLVNAQEAHAAQMELTLNPMLAMNIALTNIRAHILETNQTIEQFLRNDVFMPALNEFKSQLDSIFGQPTKETLELQLQKDQLTLQKLEMERRGAGEKELKGINDRIESIDREIQIRETQHKIWKAQIELQDKMLQTEAGLFDQAQLLGAAIAITSQKVFDLSGVVFFQSLAAINAANGLNLVADAARAAAGSLGGGSASGNAVGGPAGGGFSIMNEGSSGSDELVKLPSGSWVFSASQARAMMRGGGGGAPISIQIFVENKQDIRREVMRALDSALASAELSGSYVGTGSFQPRG